MIYVNKDYNDIPRILLSDRTEQSIRHLLDKSNINQIVSYELFSNKEVEQKLRKIYNNKCAYCESKLDKLQVEGTPIDSFEISHYRPKSKYKWLSYEWSNLLLVCPDCSKAKGETFPIENESKRITEPQPYRSDWKANSESFLNEGALLLHPEIDKPEEHLSFYPDGRIYGLTKKGKTTIDSLKLNRNNLILKRVEIVLKYQNIFLQKLKDIKDVLDSSDLDSEKNKKIIKVALESVYNELKEKAKDESEFAMLYKKLVTNFDSFVSEWIDDNFSRKILSQGLLVWNTMQYNDDFKKQIEVSNNLSENYKIKSLHISNIKCFNEVEIELNNKNTVLLGVNGRGKTTFLQLIALCVTNTVRPRSENEWKNVIKKNEETASFELEIESQSKKNNTKFVFQIDNQDKLIQQNIQEAGSPIYDNIFIAYGTGRNAEQHNFRLDDNFQDIATLFGINNLMSHNGDVFNFLSQPNAFRQIKSIITKIFNKAEDISNRIELSRYDRGSNTFYFITPTNPDSEIPLSALSAGFRTSFQWILDMALRIWKKGHDLEKPEAIPGIVLIDEIDTHLHIKWQRTILYSLTSVFKNIQFIVTTHSPFVVQSIEDVNVVALRLDKKSNSVTAENVRIEQGSSYETIIQELFDENGIFDIETEEIFKSFYQKRDAIIRGDIELNDSGFQQIISDLRGKGEEVNAILNRELRQIDFLLNRK